MKQIIKPTMKQLYTKYNKRQEGIQELFITSADRYRFNRILLDNGYSRSLPSSTASPIVILFFIVLAF